MKHSILAFSCVFVVALETAGCAANPQSAGGAQQESSTMQQESSAIQVEATDALDVWEIARLKMGGSVIRGEDEYRKNQGSSKNAFLVIGEDGTYTQYDKSITTGTWEHGAVESLALTSARGEKIVVTIDSDTLAWFDDANDITMTFHRAEALSRASWRIRV